MFDDRFLTPVLEDPAHTRDPSGCTAVAALVTHDKKIYVVRRNLDCPYNLFTFDALLGQCWRLAVSD